MKCLIFTSCLFLIGTILAADPISFDFADPKGVNTINFNLDAQLEAINGNAKGVSGRIQFDPEAPHKTTGNLEVDTASMHVSNPLMKEHLHGSQWMEVKKYPKISFKVTSLGNLSTHGNITTADVTGELTIKGITREITSSTTLTFLQGKLKARMGPRGPDGDLLVLRTKFIVNRSDFEINAGQNTEKVAEEIEISLSLAGQAPYWTD
ncbi:MAG: YceI family protein [Opitutae bacterium]|nr:YceI family protein [Opitutae bacterium]